MGVLFRCGVSRDFSVWQARFPFVFGASGASGAHPGHPLRWRKRARLKEPYLTPPLGGPQIAASPTAHFRWRWRASPEQCTQFNAPQAVEGSSFSREHKGQAHDLLHFLSELGSESDVGPGNEVGPGHIWEPRGNKSAFCTPSWSCRAVFVRVRRLVLVGAFFFLHARLSSLVTRPDKASLRWSWRAVL